MKDGEEKHGGTGGCGPVCAPAGAEAAATPVETAQSVIGAAGLEPTGEALQAVAGHVAAFRPDRRALTRLSSDPRAIERIVAQRRHLADALLMAARQSAPADRSGPALPDALRHAFGLVTPHHVAAIMAAIRDGRFGRAEAMRTAFDGAGLRDALGGPTVDVPLAFETAMGMRVTGVAAGAGAEARARVEAPYELAGPGGSPIRLMVGNGIELWRVAKIRQMEPETLQWLDRTLRPGDVLCDVGANIGLFTLYALAGRPEVRAVAVEPDPANFARLHENLRLNGTGPRALVYPLALSDRVGPARFARRQTEAGGASPFALDGGGPPDRTRGGAADAAGAPPVQVAGAWCIRLDDLFDGPQAPPAPTHLKIDVDGPQLAVLRGAAATLARPGLRHVLVELFDDELPEADALLGARGLRRTGGRGHGVARDGRSVGNHRFARGDGDD